MAKPTITRERLEQLANFKGAPVTRQEEQELARMALAAMDSEPVAYIFKHPAGRLFWSLTDESNKGHDDVMPVYASPQPAPERDQVRIAHAEWSQATFGNVGPVGPLKHLSKEALEAAAEPGDLSEWADMQFLLWDAQRRADITDDQITQAMIEKLVVNKQREWPEPKDGEPRLHIKEQPAPVVAEEATPDSIEILASARRRDLAVFQWDEDQRNAAADSWNACRAAMLAAAPQSPGSEPATIPGKWIPVSERMPEVGDIVLTAMGGAVNVGEMECSAANCLFFTSVISGRELPATHWMPLPAGPKEDINALIPLVSRNEQEGK